MEKTNHIPLLLLHGALGTKQQFELLISEFSDTTDIHRIDFEGHGTKAPPKRPFKMEYFVENVVSYLQQHGITQVNIFGYSMGGYVALLLAKKHPDYVNKLATLGTILQWNEQLAERECRYLNPEKIEEKVPHFADKLEHRHGSEWHKVVDYTREMLLQLGKNPNIKEGEWKDFEHPIRFHVGDGDTTAGLENTMKIYKKIDHAELCVLPSTAHPIEEAKEELLMTSLSGFFRMF
jgi:pimeloyl-ACP methyl ester carboxylesterase